MHGGAQVGRQEFVPEWEAQELLRLALIVRADCVVDLGDPDARRVIADLFGALALVERVGRRLHEQALCRLLADMEHQPLPVEGLPDLAQLAGVTLERVEELAARREATRGVGRRTSGVVDDPVVEDRGG